MLKPTIDDQETAFDRDALAAICLFLRPLRILEYSLSFSLSLRLYSPGSKSRKSQKGKSKIGQLPWFVVNSSATLSDPTTLPVLRSLLTLTALISTLNLVLLYNRDVFINVCFPISFERVWPFELNALLASHLRLRSTSRKKRIGRPVLVSVSINILKSFLIIVSVGLLDWDSTSIVFTKLTLIELLK